MKLMSIALKLLILLFLKENNYFETVFFIRPLHVRLSNKHVDRFTVVQ
jgi:hypothetical protein